MDRPEANDRDEGPERRAEGEAPPERPPRPDGDSRTQSAGSERPASEAPTGARSGEAPSSPDAASEPDAVPAATPDDLPTGSEPRSGAESSPPASGLRRIIAFLVDAGVVVLFHTRAASGNWLFSAIFYGLYQTVPVSSWGRTLGKAVLGLSVEAGDRVEGGRIPWHAALLRSTLGYAASAFLGLGFLHVLRDPRRRGWHDVLAGSVVVQESGALTLGRAVDALDRWSKRAQEAQRRILGRYRTLGQLGKLAAELVTLMTGLYQFVGRAVGFVAERLRRDKRRPTGSAQPGMAAGVAAPAAVGPKGALIGGATGGGAATSATSVVAAAMLAAGTMVIVVGAGDLAPSFGGLPDPPREVDGRVVGTGDVRATLTWEGTADLDLHVRAPSGFTVSYSDTISPTGGSLDHDAHANCAADFPLENIFWPEQAAPTGEYVVSVNRYDDCDQLGPVQWRVDVEVDGRTTEFHGLIEPGQPAQVVTTFRR